jgi:hypothetical protein
MEEVSIVKVDTIVAKGLVRVPIIVINLEDRCVKRLWELTQKLQKTNDFSILESDGLENELT